MIQEIIEKFIKKHNKPLLTATLADKEFDFIIFYNNNILNIEKSSDFESSPKNPKILTVEEITRYIPLSSFSSVSLSNYYFTINHIITEDFIDSISHLSQMCETLSEAQNVQWSEELIEKYKYKWNWRSLSKNETIPWSIEFIKKYSDLIDFELLSGNKKIKINKSLINKYKDRWDWTRLSGNPILVNQLGGNILDDKRIIWTKPNYKYDDYSLNFSGFTSCICTNTGINWNLNRYERYRNKIDFWLLANFGDIDEEVINKYGNELDENRIVSTNFTRSSDWRDSHPWYRNGWENLFLNENFILSKKSLTSGGPYINPNDSLKEIELIRYSGNAREGHTQYKIKKPITYLINPERINFSFEDLSYFYYIFPKTILDINHIDFNLYEMIIKPELLKNRKLVNIIFDSLIE